ncbi:Ser/Thr protein kinase RdoA (MazF antagonist) [Microlunatus parietis]|uniref:Ser/Thr protein kinase RdoA (MazF antagonist) n=2 Tax=Microlunatus parietis TaxID=682979 RepID=A0A7Y9I6M4_9ACTN|nr:Ser/Thr protein kinase RdoA (MazF antagonist) [Microlunatus parietis]
MTMPERLTGFLEQRYGLRISESEAVLGQGDEASVWRVLGSGRRLIVRASPPERDLAKLAESYALAAVLAGAVPEVTAPIGALDGSVTTRWAGRPISVWPYIEGDFLDRSDHDQLRAAAELLARLHRAGVDWLSARGEKPERPGIGLVHGDFYSRNLLVRDGRIAGLIDWDDARLERLDAELAWATWELGKTPTGDALLLDHAARFLETYRHADGPGQPGADFIRLIRARLIGELGGDDPDYDASLRTALRNVVDDDRHRDLIRSGAG